MALWLSGPPRPGPRIMPRFGGFLAVFALGGDFLWFSEVFLRVLLCFLTGGSRVFLLSSKGFLSKL